MAKDCNADVLFEEIVARRLHRRSLLKRAAVLGLSTPVIAGLLAACGGEDDAPTDDSPEATSPPAAGDSTPVAETTEVAGEGETPRRCGRNHRAG